LKKILHHSFFIRLFNWEYWPIQLANFPVFLIVLWFGLRARKITFFTAVNPTIETGGLFGESKINILDQIPEKFLPKTVFVPKDSNFQEVKKQVLAKKITYPLIVKPDVGERGLLVEKIQQEADLEIYLKKHNVNFLIQEFIDLPEEWAVMHHRFPNEKTGKITSICIKDPLKVTGNGVSTVRQLMEAFPRAILQLPRFEQQKPKLLNSIPKKEEVIILEPIGNHSRGTTFLNGNHLISQKMEAVFDAISNQMEGIYYGRFDMKCASAEAVERGEFKVMEYNGIGAEPAHIYDPKFSFLKIYPTIYRHWKVIFKIYKIQRKKGVKADSIKKIKNTWQQYNSYMASIEN